MILLLLPAQALSTVACPFLLNIATDTSASEHPLATSGCKLPDDNNPNL